ncbi:hypothetical protein F5880DRAFT_721937 [Lentinula raphanica]|nr:hypothetical protein F5880DRAFT_721937 [Lentinula raphanica]
MAPPALTLRVNAQVSFRFSYYLCTTFMSVLKVMLIKNVDENLVNGSMGRVVRFCDAATYAENDTSLQASSSSLSKPASSSKSAPTAQIKQLLPVVEFSMPNGGRKEMLVGPDSFKVELPNGEIQAARSQVSLLCSSL